MNKNNLENILSCSALTKTFADGELYVEVLAGINLQVKAKETLAIVGPSGSGKSTLLHLLGGLDRQTAGTVNICGTEINKLSEAEKGNLRNRYLGFVYQFHHLLPEFTALENVCMPLLIAKTPIAEAEARAREMLKTVGLQNRELHRSSELSGGERQRVAIARALVTNPKCVLADEPTGNLDHKHAEKIYDLIIKLNQELGTAFVVVTHDLSIARRMQKVFVLQDGCLREANADD